MSYEKTIWVKDDIVTADKLNKIEDQLESNTENLENLRITIEEQRDPTETDTEYLLGSTWLNTETGKAFILINLPREEQYKIKESDMPIPIRQGTKIYFENIYSSNIQYTMQINNSAAGENNFPALRMFYGGGWAFYYNQNQYYMITNTWNSDFNPSYSNSVIDWNKDTQTITILADIHSEFNNVTSPQMYTQSNNITVDTPLGARWVEISSPKLNIINGDVESNKYISQITLDNHNVVVTKADLPQGFSGDYRDLSNKPTMPTKTSELVNDSDFATNASVDSKINSIPKITKVSELENDEDFITEEYVDTRVEDEKKLSTNVFNETPKIAFENEVLYQERKRGWEALGEVPIYLRKDEIGTNRIQGSAIVGDEIFWIGGTLRTSHVTATPPLYGASNKNISYNLRTNTWKENLDLPYRKDAPTLVAVGTDIYILGGIGRTNKFYPFDSVFAPDYKYDTLTNTYEELSSLQDDDYLYTSMQSSGADHLDGKIYISGRYWSRKEKSTGAAGVLTAPRLAIYDIATDTWTFGPTPPMSNDGGSSKIVNRKLYVYRNTFYAYDIDTETWSEPLSVANIESRSHTSMAVRDGLIYLIGGYISSSSPVRTSGKTYVYDPVLNEWEEDVDLLLNNDYGMGIAYLMAVVWEGRLVTYGGTGKDENIYGPETNIENQFANWYVFIEGFKNEKDLIVIFDKAKEYTDDKISEEITAEKVKQLYEANPDTNVFTDAEKAKLSSIEEGAEVNTVSPKDLESKYNFVDFFEGMDDFNIDTDCDERTIYINISTVGLGTFPSGYIDGGFLLQTWRGTGQERKAQMLFDPHGGKTYSRVQVGEEVWGEWEDHTLDISNKLNIENPDFTGVMYYEGEEALKIVKALEGMGCTINAPGNDTEEKCIAAGGQWVEVNVVNGDNIFIGPNAGNVNVGQGKVWAYQGTGNYAFGADALKSLSLGKFNIAVGPTALNANTEGDFNIAIGRAALIKNSTGKHLIAIGDSAFFSAINQMIEGVAIGYQAFGQASQGSENVAFGYQAGLRTEGGSFVTTVNKGVFLGGRTRAKNSTSNNEIVIGNRAIGNGDNTITVGNDEIEKTYLKGDVYLEEDKKVKSNAIPTDEEDLVNKNYVDEELAEKQDKLVAGDNITINPTTNVISASGGIGGTVDWQDIENKPALYNKTEIDLMLGDIESALDAILGV
ncbi:MAG: hypothetical protein M0Q88_00885 [Bacilli bacterium]|nr:hypothetical protein [Bacilli bacterium]